MKLFKYFAPERVDVIENLKISFTDPTVFNDPFDCVPSYTSIGGANQLGDRAYFASETPDNDRILDHVRRSQAVDPSYSLDAVILSPPGNLDLIAEGFREALLQFGGGNEYLVLSLTENGNSLPMWAHYAKDHTGFLVEFNASHHFFRTNGHAREPGTLHKVTYSKHRPHGAINTLSLIESHLTKSEDWESEHEWRILQKRSNAQDVINLPSGSRVHLFDLPRECITSVVLGVRAEKIAPLIQSATSKRSIPLLRSVVHERD